MSEECVSDEELQRLRDFERSARVSMPAQWEMWQGERSALLREIAGLRAELTETRREALREARAIVRAAPTMSHGERYVDGPGCFPAVEDTEVRPGLYSCTYGLRDAMLHWLDERLVARPPTEESRDE